ncbi:MAG: cation:proton antiporter, partial [Pseudorhodobacter sp.]|nr:cation:proton antiporter [Pseudorhodobacter sp.]
ALPWAVWRGLGGRQTLPLVVVQIVGGILLGPGILGTPLPAVYATVFRPEVIAALNALAMWAVMLFVFVAGLELNVTEAWAKRRETTLTAGLALLVPLGLGSVAAVVLLQNAGWLGEKGNYWQAVLGIGMACAVTALPILIMFLDQLKMLRQPLGQRVLRYASLDDVAIWAVLALILLDWNRLGRQTLFVAGFVVAVPLLRRLIPRLNANDRWIVGLIWLAASGFAADWSGLHYMVGAFLSGAVLDARWFDLTRVDSFRAAVLTALMPVFFLSTGLRTSWEMGGWTAFAAAALLLVASVGGKLIGTHLAGYLLGWQRAETWIIGWLLQTKALIMIIFANILLDKQIITPATFTALLLMALASTLLTMPVVIRLLARRPDLDRMQNPVESNT